MQQNWKLTDEEILFMVFAGVGTTTLLFMELTILNKKIFITGLNIIKIIYLSHFFLFTIRLISRYFDSFEGKLILDLFEKSNYF